MWLPLNLICSQHKFQILLVLEWLLQADSKVNLHMTNFDRNKHVYSPAFRSKARLFVYNGAEPVACHPQTKAYAHMSHFVTSVGSQDIYLSP